eukprot:g4576.t1
MDTKDVAITISNLTKYEPRPGENTYTRSERVMSQRPGMRQLREPAAQAKERLTTHFDSPNVNQKNGGAERRSSQHPDLADTHPLTEGLLDVGKERSGSNSASVPRIDQIFVGPTAVTPVFSPRKARARTSSDVADPRVNGGGANEGGVEMSEIVSGEPSEGMDAAEDLDADKFGMWDGVFARCLLNIFGVIMFLRVPWMVAYAGVLNSLLIIIVSVVITTISATSLSAICTNGLVAGGGAYYLISRSLGPEFGGAIGIMFFVANAVAVPMYLIGFAETIVNMAGGETIMVEGWDLRIISFISLAFITIICFAGLKYVVKFQLMLLALLVLSILAFIVGIFIPHPELPAYNDGLSTDIIGQNFMPDWNRKHVVTTLNGTTLRCEVPTPNGPTPTAQMTAAEVLETADGSVNFAVALAVFFPAVTGIMAGANISGDLKDPSSAIPKGTNLALGVSTIVYIVLVFCVGASGIRSVAGIAQGEACPFGGTFHDSSFMARVSLWPPIVYAGIFASTLSSGIASLVGAPRILQAVAKDKLFPYTDILAKGTGSADEPLMAYALTILITVGCVLVGELNAIAPLITNFFMSSYALTNFACYSNSIAKTPGWRPTFRYYNKWLSLFGTFLCVIFMFWLNLWMSLATVIIGIMLHQSVAFLKPDVNWGSAGEGARYLRVLRSLRALETTREHVKNWRPSLLVLADSAADSAGSEEANLTGMLKLTRDCRKGHGMSIVGSVIVGGTAEADGGLLSDTISGVEERGELLSELLAREETKAFSRAICADSMRSGRLSLMQASGVGKMKPNTLMLSFLDDWESKSPSTIRSYVSTIGDAFDLGYGVIILRNPQTYSARADSPPTKKDIEADDMDPKERAMRASRASVQGLLELVVEDLDEDDEEDERNAQEAAIEGMHEDDPSVDCWWLSDDGGLTLLVPHLILQSKMWRGKRSTKMRLMNTLREDELARAGRELTRLDDLVNKKFRIGAEVVNVILGAAGKTPGRAGKKYRRKLDVAFQNLRREMQEQDKEDLDRILNKCANDAAPRIRIGQVIAKRSKSARLVVISIPVPRKDKMVNEWYPYYYMSLLDAISKVPDVPVVLIHGSQEDVLTFYS